MADYQYPNSHIPPTPTYQIPPPAPSKILMPPPMHPSVYATPAPATTGYTLPQYQQAQQLFQRDAQIITPEALESVKAALASSEIEHKAETKKRAIPRKAAGQTWEDPALAEWPENDYRLFCGDLGNEVNDEVLSKTFTKFPTFNMARVSFRIVLDSSVVVLFLSQLHGSFSCVIKAHQLLLKMNLEKALCTKPPKLYTLAIHERPKVYARKKREI